MTASVVALAGCGEQKMSAGEFVDKIKEQGVRIRLGEELHTSDPTKKIYGVELKQLAPVKEGQEPLTDGAVSVYDHTDDADEGFQRCRSAGLACFQAANIVVIFEGNGIEARQVGVAIQRLGD